MIVQMTRTSSPESTTRRDALAGVSDEINGAIRLLRCAATGRMVKQGISMTHLHVMWRLEEFGELPMSRLADVLDVSLSNATGLIDRMEERGLIERTRDTDDRRVVLVRLTPAGTELLEEIQIMRRDLMTAVLERLDDRQLDRLHSALIDFRAAVRTEEIANPEMFGVYHEHLRHERPQGAEGRENTTR